MMITSLLAVAALQAGSPEIVVTGVPLSQLERAAALCDKGGCTPREDIIATVRYAEGLFRVGRYLDSRRTLQQAIGRNKVAARSDPPALMALYEATATVARHEGEQRVWESATYARSRIVRDTVPADSAERVFSDLEVLTFEGRRHPQKYQTELKYAALLEKAKATGNQEAVARVAIQYAMFTNKQGNANRALGLLRKAIDNGAIPAPYRHAARAVAARVASDSGDKAAADAFLADITKGPQSPTPLLVWAPPTPRPTDTVSGDTMAGPVVDSASRASEVFTLGWVDIGFAIKPDGSVEAPAVLRGNRGDRWAAPLLAAIGARRYSQTPVEASGMYRIERWTLTADYHAMVGTFIRKRLITPRYEQLDVSPEPPRVTASKS